MSIQKRVLAIAFNLPVVFAIGVFGLARAQPQSGVPAGTSFASKSNRVRLVATVNKDPKTGTLVLRWSLRNVSQTDIRFQEDNLFRNYKITVSDSFGKPIPLTRRGQDELRGSYFGSHREAFILHPGETKKKEIVIADYYDVKPSGVYVISVERQIATGNGQEMEKAQSKAIRFRF